MNREVHVRFWESPEVKVLRATRQVRRLKRALKRRPHIATRQRIQMVLLRESGMTQPEIAAAMGVSLKLSSRLKAFS
jgi:DNA-directed RNA polymerase specialized sigma24 family protein